MNEPGSLVAPDRFLALGFSRLARVISVVHLERGEKVRTISTRRASRSERKPMSTDETTQAELPKSRSRKCPRWTSHARSAPTSSRRCGCWCLWRSAARAVRCPPLRSSHFFDDEGNAVSPVVLARSLALDDRRTRRTSGWGRLVPDGRCCTQSVPHASPGHGSAFGGCDSPGGLRTRQLRNAPRRCISRRA
jgi:hypothetical protein